MIKVIGIGNLLMRDDGIALKIIEAIEKELQQLGLGIKCIKAETDFNYALDNIEEDDFLFIIDSTDLGLKCGQVTIISLEEGDNYSNNSLSVHSISLVSLIKDSNLKVTGFILGVEVKEVWFGLELSEEISTKFNDICKRIYKIIRNSSLVLIKKGEGSA
ncbi:MAG: hydrogenase maturation protease [Clostridiaceae bacterium]